MLVYPSACMDGTGGIHFTLKRMLIMIRFPTIIAFTLLATTTAMAEDLPSCNPAKQNWEHGSKTTCTVVDRGSTDTRIKRERTEQYPD